MPCSISGSNALVRVDLCDATMTVVSSPPCVRVLLDPLRVQDHGRRRRNSEHDSDRNYQTP